MDDLQNIPCKGCGKRFTQTRYWQRFCGSICKKNFYRKEAQEGRDLLRKKRNEVDLKDL